MWGDVRGATDLDTSSPLSTLLLQLTGPASIPLSSPQWRSILLHYDKLAHLNPQDNVLVKTACRAMARHAVSSSNLAALTLHVVRMLTDLYGHASKGGGMEEEEEDVVVLVGKVRATCGALNLLRILSHETIESCCDGATTATENGEGEEGGDGRRISLGASSAVEEVFVYRDVTDGGESHRRDAASELLSILIPFLSLPHPPPALYDATIFSLSLLLVLLSTQLYQPMISSAQLEEGYSQLSPSERDSIPGYHPFLTRLMKLPHSTATTNGTRSPAPTSLVATALQWFAKRPPPPPRSIAARHCEMTTSLVHSKGHRPTADGLYDNHRIVAASCRRGQSEETTREDLDDGEEGGGRVGDYKSSSFIGSATQGVIDITSTIILLPFRLVRLAMSTIGLIGPYDISSGMGRDKGGGGGVMDVMWMSDSPLADMGCCLLLLLAHNHHSKDTTKVTNPFREELALMRDVRWEDTDVPPAAVPPATTVVAVNFEGLFEAFGATLHNEMGALLLYTMLQSSPAFAASIAVRSDLDTLVMPLLRTVYFSSSVHYDVRGGDQDSNKGGMVSSRPFRSHSQLYVILILLLLFSQDNSFGPDAFRRVTIPSIPWYKERQLKDISLGSVVLLSLLRSITYNLHRLQDGFLMSNCCAILLNLSPHVVMLHSYAAMRLASVTVSCMKRYTILVGNNGGVEEEEEEGVSGMFGEACRTLLQILRICLRMDRIEKNTQVLYALLYLKRDFDEVVSSPSSPFKPSDIGALSSILSHTEAIIQKDGESLTAVQAMDRLENSMDKVKTAMRTTKMFDDDNNDDAPNDDLESDFAFLYEEDDDSEVFFVPYVWEVIVCAVTAGYLEWDKRGVKVFATEMEGREEEEEGGELEVTINDGATVEKAYSEDVMDVV